MTCVKVRSEAGHERPASFFFVDKDGAAQEFLKPLYTIMLFNNLNISSMNVLEKTNTFVKKGADQCANFAGRVKNEAPGFFKNVWEVTKRNKEVAIAATVLTGAAVIAYKMGKSRGRKQQK